MDRAELLEQYRGGYAAVESAVAAITDAELDRPAPDGGWTARQVVHHLADSEARAFIRLRRLIAEDEPEILGYDEPEYARRLYYDRPIASSLAVVSAVRTASLELLERLTDEEWNRTGSHSESGPYSVETWLRIYANHPYDHARQIAQARGAASA
jgi:hypothetical protein